MYNDKLKESIKEILENDTRIGTYEDNTFIIFEGWTTIRQINALMGYNDEYDHRTGSDKLDLDNIIPWVYSNIPFPIDQNDINRFYKDMEINRLIENGQLSYIDNIKPDLSIFEEVKDIILQYENDMDLDYLNEDIKELIGESEWGFSDEYDLCYECNNILRTSADSYDWVPDYYEDMEGYRTCKECSQDMMDYAIEDIQNSIDQGDSPRSLSWIFDLTDEWHIIQPDPRYDFSRWENGLHGGQIDSPLKQGQLVLENKNQDGESLFEVVYRIHPSQFYVEWDTYIRINPSIENQDGIDLNEWIEYFRDKFNSSEGHVNHDPKVLMEKALKQVKPNYSKIETDQESGEINITGSNDINEFLESYQ